MHMVVLSWTITTLSSPEMLAMSTAVNPLFAFVRAKHGMCRTYRVVDVLVPAALPSGRYYYCVLIFGDARSQSETVFIDNPAIPPTCTAPIAFPSTLLPVKSGRRLGPEFVAGLAFGSLMLCYIRPLSRWIIRALTGEEPMKTLSTSGQDIGSGTASLLGKAS
ncbi:hypothetical protein C8Q73DRAFT_191960 [Cubamyces lactineus]|nr:hypothetical protein C8Q73DRAFT_191960 [Cubamyces lactineus]